MRLTTRFSEAVEYARAHHADDVRKGTAAPYLSHLLAVSALVLEHGGDETAAVAALLHDVVEDGGGERALADIRDRFGPEVAAIVEGCSDTTAAVKEDWDVRKQRYLRHLESASPEILLVSAADKLHNARTILGDLREHGDALWARFNRGVKEQLWYYGSLRDVFCRRLPGRLADELDRTVRDVNRLVDPDGRIEALGVDFMFWSFSDADTGACVDWSGMPLVITKARDGLVVYAEVGREVLADYEPGDLEGLETFIDVELGDLRLEYREPAEVAWLVCHDRGDLREACEEVARLAPVVTRRMLDLEVMRYPPTTTFADRVEHGPWYCDSGPPPRSDLRWTERGRRSWTATGPSGAHWEIRDRGGAGPERFSITIAHWDRPDWWAPTLDAAQRLAAEIDARPPIPPSEWVVERPARDMGPDA